MSTKQRIKNFEHPYLIFSLTVVIVLLVITTIINTAWIIYLNNQNNIHSNQNFATLIQKSVEYASKSMPVEPSGQQFIPEQKLILPENDKFTNDLLYRSLVTDDGTTSEVSIASRQDVQNAEIPMFNANSDPKSVVSSTDKLQTCSRGVRVAYKNDNYGLKVTLSTQKTLANGKTVYISMEKLCANKDLFDYVSKIDSY